MWYPTNITESAVTAPVTLDEVKLRLRIDAEDDSTDVEMMIAAATDHAEKYCNTRFSTQTVVMKCDSFADFGYLPEAPVQSVESITYIDTSGAQQTLQETVYEVRADGLEAEIVLKYGQHWPAVQHGSRISVTAVVGYDVVPNAVTYAILLLIGDAYCNRESAGLGTGRAPAPGALWVAGWSTTDTLLSNYRRGTSYEGGGSHLGRAPFGRLVF